MGRLFSSVLFHDISDGHLAKSSLLSLELGALRIPAVNHTDFLFVPTPPFSRSTGHRLTSVTAFADGSTDIFHQDDSEAFQTGIPEEPVNEPGDPPVELEANTGQSTGHRRSRQPKTPLQALADQADASARDANARFDRMAKQDVISYQRTRDADRAIRSFYGGSCPCLCGPSDHLLCGTGAEKPCCCGKSAQCGSEEDAPYFRRQPPPDLPQHALMQLGERPPASPKPMHPDILDERGKVISYGGPRMRYQHWESKLVPIEPAKTQGGNGKDEGQESADNDDDEDPLGLEADER